MKRSLKDLMQQGREQRTDADTPAIPAAQNVMEQYGGRSEAELLGELKAARMDGRLDPTALAGAAEQLTPYLNEEQRQRLFSLMQQIAPQER